MTRKDFVLIARTIHDLPADTIADRAYRQMVAEHFADACATTNGAFDRGRFMRACLTPVKGEDGRHARNG